MSDIPEQDVAITDEIPYGEKYKMFDDMALGVMERNAASLESEEGMLEEHIKGAPVIELRFDVTTARNREQNGANCEVNIRDMIHRAYTQKTGNDQMPSECCYIDTLSVEDATNTLPIDMHLTCRQDDKLYGSYHKAKVSGEEELHRENPSLFVLHSGSKMHLDNGREVYKSGAFKDSKAFKTYRQALKKDVEDSATMINGGAAVEYLSPWAVLSEDDVLKGDWFVNVIYKNPGSFKHMVQAVQTPVASKDGEKETYVCSLRMHTEDWKKLNSAVQSGILNPLRRNMIDLQTNDTLHFSLEPDSVHKEVSSSMMNKTNSSESWHDPLLKGHEGRAAVSMKATIRFV